MMMIASILVLMVIRPASVLEGLVGAVNEALKISFSLTALYAIWMGIMRIIEELGFNRKLSVGLRPMIYFLFGRVSDKAAEYISMNIAANLLGMGNAATPMGIKAMTELDDASGRATDAAVMLLVINASSLQILPTTVITLRASMGSSAPADIVLPTILTSFISLVCAVSLVKLFLYLGKKRQATKEKKAVKQADAKQLAINSNISQEKNIPL